MAFGRSAALPAARRGASLKGGPLGPGGDTLIFARARSCHHAIRTRGALRLVWFGHRDGR